jgi:hypothetical protein
MVGYSFIVTDGPDLGRTFVLTAGITIIGRLDAPAADDPPGSVRWTLTDPAVSRTHAQITWDGENAPVLIHLSTTNATLLNGRIVTGQSLEHGQSLHDKQNLRMGQTGLEVQVVDTGSAWNVLDGERTVPIGDEEWARSGVVFATNPHGVKVTLVDDSAEAYLLRKLDGTLWTTPLKPDIPVAVAEGDILRLDDRRLVIAAAAPTV